MKNMIHKRKYNIMHLVLSLETGGLERLVTDSAIAIDKNIFNVDICCFNKLCGFYETLVDKKINVTLLKRNQNRYDYLYAIKLKKLIAEKAIDILHMHSGTFFHGIQAGVLARTPVMIYTDHGRQLIEPKIDLLMDRFSSYFVDKIVAVSNELENYLVDKIKLPKHKITTIINGVNTDIFTVRTKPIDLMMEFGINETDLVIGTVGRLAEVKDQSTLIDAFNIVRKALPNSILLIVGDGLIKKELEEKINKLNLNTSVKLLGNRKDIPYILNIMDVFVLSSLSEGTSVALLEAMASGVAPVVTNVGGNPSIVEDNINGKIVEPRSANQMAETLIAVLVDEGKRRKYSEAASIKINTNYSINYTLKQYSDLYLEILKDKGFITI